jgi:hypothetical protein
MLLMYIIYVPRLTEEHKFGYVPRLAEECKFGCVPRFWAQERKVRCAPRFWIEERKFIYVPRLAEEHKLLCSLALMSVQSYVRQDMFLNYVSRLTK